MRRPVTALVLAVAAAGGVLPPAPVAATTSASGGRPATWSTSAASAASEFGADPDDAPPAVDAGDGSADGAAGPLATAALVGPSVVALGTAPSFPGSSDLFTNLRVVGGSPTPAGGGLWLTARDGGVFAFGDAGFFGSTGAMVLNQPVVGMASTPSGRGYWLVARDGGVFTFGDAGFFGSTGAMVLNQPVVGMASTPSGRGYWLVARDGGVFAFGDAGFFGSTGAMVLNQPVVGMASTPSGRGYWLVARDGGMFSFGDAAFHGASPRPPTAPDVAGMAASRTGAGYLVVGSDGTIDAFGDAPRLAGPDAAALGTGSVAAVALTPDGQGAWLAVGRVTQRVTVSQPRGLTQSVALAATGSGRAAGGDAAVVHSGTLGLVGVLRSGGVVQAPPPGWRFPVATLAVEPSTAAALMGPAVSRALEAGEVVLGATSAGLRSARPGDELALVGWDGVVRRVHVGFVAPDDQVGWAELLVSTATAAGMGLDRPASVWVWDFRSRDAVEGALAVGLPRGVRLGVSRSWDPADPDDVLPSSVLKATFGEFAYAPGGGDAIVQDPGWRAANIRTEQLPILGAVTCHRLALPALRGALAEVQAAGLAGLIDVADSRNGGCHFAREIRGGGGTTGGAISRHSWGLAIDINPSTNPFGGTPRMDGRIVAIFRRWGFAWGGTWTLPDGMHFELARVG